MKTAEVKTPAINSKENTNNAPVAGNNESKLQMINNLPVSTAFNDVKGETKKEEAKPQTSMTPEPVKAEQLPQAEPTKKELKEAIKAKVFSLEETVKLISGLGKRIAQRDKLKNTIDNLDNFVIAQSDDEDVTGSNKFQRCELSITDDNGNEFVTKNPYIIDQVAQFVNSLCVEKLAEIEASIIIPA